MKVKATYCANKFLYTCQSLHAGLMEVIHEGNEQGSQILTFNPVHPGMAAFTKGVHRSLSLYDLKVYGAIREFVDTSMSPCKVCPGRKPIGR